MWQQQRQRRESDHKTSQSRSARHFVGQQPRPVWLAGARTANDDSSEDEVPIRGQHALESGSERLCRKHKHARTVVECRIQALACARLNPSSVLDFMIFTMRDSRSSRSGFTSRPIFNAFVATVLPARAQQGRGRSDRRSRVVREALHNDSKSGHNRDPLSQPAAAVHHVPEEHLVRQSGNDVNNEPACRSSAAAEETRQLDA